MDPLKALKDKFKRLPDALPGIMKESFEQIKASVEDMNIEQLDRGERADYSSLPNYSITSIRKFGKPPGPMILYDQGDFWQGITLVVTDDGVELVGRDLKTQMLQLRYGDNIIGLQEDNKERVEQDHLAPEMEPRVKEYFEK